MKKYLQITFNEGLGSRICKELLNLNSKKKKNLTRKLAKKTVNRHFTEGDIQMANKHRKRCSKSLAIREMQNVKNFIEHIRKAKITKKKMITPNAG